MPESQNDYPDLQQEERYHERWTAYIKSSGLQTQAISIMKFISNHIADFPKKGDSDLGYAVIRPLQSLGIEKEL
ncbi:hypothetical protein V6N12_047172 [Hibiscus sabdariffa]|uniref:Uncharacterized protein n=1 Tax=Hibiscus sabdariffa TaxID=183260 RepID=A0ABR2DA39_9ROSI